MDFKGFARLCWDPFAVDVGDIFLEEGRVFELERQESQYRLTKSFNGSEEEMVTYLRGVRHGIGSCYNLRQGVWLVV